MPAPRLSAPVPTFLVLLTVAAGADPIPASQIQAGGARRAAHGLVGPFAAALTQTSPANGEVGVSLTRETILRFDQALHPTSAFTGGVTVTSVGQALPFTPRVSADGLALTLFYVQPLPDAQRVRVTVDGDLLLDVEGRLVDANGDGVPGGMRSFEFDTTSLAPFPGTKVSGRVFASELAPGGGSINVPLQGVRVAVDGAESTLFALTDANGNFTLDPAPAGRIFVHIDGTTATNPVPPGGYYPKVGKAWETRPGQALNVGDAYLPLVPAGTLQPVSQTSATTLTFAPGVLAAHPELAGTQITVPAGSLFYDNGAPGTHVGIAPVPPDRLPGPLPAGLDFPIVITVQTDGAANFDAPARVRFPNLPVPGTGQPLPPDSDAALWSFNHDAGRWEAVAAARVSSNGAFIETHGSGILAPGWHGVTPGAGVDVPEGVDPCDEACQTAVRYALIDTLTLGLGGKLKNLGAAKECALGLTQSALQAIRDCAAGGQPDCTRSLMLGGFGTAEGCLGTALDWTPVLGNVLGVASTIWGTWDACWCGLLAAPVNPAEPALDLLGDWRDMTDLVLGPSRWTNLVAIQTGTPQDMARAKTLLRQAALATAPTSDSGDLVSPAERSVLLALPRPSGVLDSDINQLVDRFNLTTTLWSQGIYTHAQAGQTGFTDRDQFVASVDQVIASMPAAQAAYGYHFDIVTPFRRMHDELIALIDDVEAGTTSSSEILFALEGGGLPATRRGRTDALPSLPAGLGELLVRITLLDTNDLSIGSTSLLSPRVICATDASGNGRCVFLPPYVPKPIWFGNDLFPDADGDSLSDIGEFVAETNANDPDSDDDGVTDAAEILQGLNPLDNVTVATGIIATAPTAATALDVAAFGDLAVVARGSAGIAAYNVFNAMPPVLVARVDTPGDAREADLSERFVAVADGPGGLAIVDADDLATASILHQVPTASLGGGAVQTVAVAGDIAFAGTGAGHVAAVELSTGAVLDILDLGASVHDFAIEGERLFVLTDSQIRELRVFDLPLSVLSSAPLQGTTPLLTNRRRLFVGGGVAYATHMRGYHTFDVGTRGMILPLGGGDTGQVGWAQVVANGSRIGVAAVGPNSGDALHDLYLYDFTNPAETNLPPTFVSSFSTPGIARSVSIYGGLAYVADSASGLQVVNYRGYDALSVPPTVALLPSPDLPQYTERTTLLLRANATDDVQIRTVELLLDGQRVQADGAFPFQFFLELPEHVAMGSNTHTLQLRATDTGGNATSTPLRNFDVVADATPPRTLATFPAAAATLPPSFFDVFAFSVLVSEALDVAALASAFEVRSAGADTMLGTTDDVLVPFTAQLVAGERRVVVRTTAAVPLGDLRLRFLASQVPDRNGNGYDGNGDGTGGDDFALDVHVTSEFTVFWDGGGNGTAWHDPANWSTDALPGAADRVLIDAPLANVVHSTSTTGVLRLSARGALTLSGGSLSIQEASDVRALTMTGTGLLGGAGTLTLTGASTWNAGRIEGAGRLVVASGAGLTTATNAPDRQRVLENHGLVVLGGNLGGPAIENGSDGLLRVQGSCSLPSVTMVNDGIVRVDTGQLRVRGSPWTNNGPIYVDAGELLFDSCCGPSNMLNQGLIRVAAGALVRNLGADFVSNGSIEGPGAVTIQGGSTTINGPFAISGAFVHSGGVSAWATGQFLATGPVTISGGVLTIRNALVASSFTGVGAAHVIFDAAQTLASVSMPIGAILDGSGEITITSALSMSSSELRGTGLLRVANGAAVTLSSGQTVFNRPFENHGVVQVTAGEWRGNGARVIAADGELVLAGGNLGGALLTNQGTWSVVASGQVRVGNLQQLGSLVVSSGELDLAGGAFSNFTNAGTISVAAGATFRNSGNTLVSTGPINAAGDVFLTNNSNSQFAAPVTCAQIFRLSGGLHDFAVGAFQASGSVEFLGGRITIRDTIAAASFSGPNGAHVIFEAPQSFPNFTLTSPGVLDGSANVTVTGSMTWSPSEIRSGGRLILAAGSTASITGAATFPLHRVLENHGAVTMNVGRIQLEGAGGLENAAGGTFEMQGESDFSHVNPTATSIANAGLLRHAGGGTAELTAFSFTNTGTIENLAGTVRFQQGWSNAGTLVASPGAILRTQGALTLGAGSTLRLGLDSTASFATCVVTGAMTFDGLLDLVVGAGYVPVVNDSFPIVTHASGTGTFASTQGDQLGGGLVLVPSYSAAGLVLTVQ